MTVNGVKEKTTFARAPRRGPCFVTMRRCRRFEGRIPLLPVRHLVRANYSGIVGKRVRLRKTHNVYQRGTAIVAESERGGGKSRTCEFHMMPQKETKQRVLIAEDDPVSCQLLKNVLAKSHHDVTVVTDGLAALKILEGEDPPRLVVLDWMMPGMEGVQVCQRIRERK